MYLKREYYNEQLQLILLNLTLTGLIFVVLSTYEYKQLCERQYSLF